MLHLQKLIRRPLDMLADLVPMCRPIKQRSQNQHVQSPLQQIRALLSWFYRHGRYSTLNKHDGRQSTIDCQPDILICYEQRFPALILCV